MKRQLSIIVLFTAILFSSCIKEEVKHFTGTTVIEFDAAVLNTATTPYTYYVATRVPVYGLTVSTANSPTLITRSLTTPVKLRVNLVGPQSSTDQVITYQVLTTPVPVAPNMLAVSGTHYTTSGTFTIPANSSFGEVTINIVNPGVSSTNPREVHIELIGNDQIKPSENYKRVAIRISQT
jgi:hypothetical protein